MRRLAWIVALVSAALLAPSAAAQEVVITSPPADRPLFGEIDVAVEVRSPQAVERVEFVVDGTLVAVDREAPYRAAADVGDSNVEHRIRVVAFGARGPIGEASLQSAIYRVDDTLEVELRQLYVSVQRAGRSAGYLGREDFEIIDDGKRQRIVTFELGDAPLTAVLLLDTSASMAGDRLGSALSGARAFVGGMAPLDEAKVVLFSDRVIRTTPFAGEPTVLEASLTGGEPIGGTAVNDYLYASLKLLDARQGRRVVVLFSDGVDVHSLLSAEEVLWKAQRSQAVIYWIYLREAGEGKGPREDDAAFNSAWRDYETNQREMTFLKDAVEHSGGRIEALESASELGEAFAGILRELREQYVLGYYPTDRRHDGSWHELEVQVRGAGRVRTREGYVDD
ncbi:MAG: VWA domain-containing protein [Thermoanaerobaculia bacterium]